MDKRTNRGLTAGVLCNVQRYFNGLKPLSDKVTDGNVVHAMFAFQIYRKGFHGNILQASAMYRHFCRLESSEVPLKQNGLAKIKGAVPLSLTAYMKERFDGTRRRTTHDDHKVVKQARHLICNHPKLKGMSLTEESAREVMEQVFEDIVALLSKAENKILLRTRLKSLERQFKKDSFFPQLICEQWEKLRKNSGNPAATWISAKEIENNNDAFDKWIAKFAPKPKETTGAPFWIRMGKTKCELKQLDQARNGILSTNGNPNWKYIHMICDFPLSCTDFFVPLVHSTFIGRLKKRKLKGQTRQARATRYIQYGMHLDYLIFSDDEEIFWTCVHLTHKQKKNT